MKCCIEKKLYAVNATLKENFSNLFKKNQHAQKHILFNIKHFVSLKSNLQFLNHIIVNDSSVQVKKKE